MEPEIRSPYLHGKACPHCGRIGNHEGECAANTQVFEWRGGGSEVHLLGDFNQWTRSGESKMLPNRIASNVFVKRVSLAPRRYLYKFLVDGHWRHDPDRPTVADGFGAFNNVINVLPLRAALPSRSSESELEEVVRGTGNDARRVVRLRWPYSGQDVQAKGSWDSWKQAIKLEPHMNPLNQQLEFTAKLELRPGMYTYKFIVDGEWRIDPWEESEGSGALENNILRVRGFMPKPRANPDFSAVLRWKRKPIVLDEALWHLALEGHSLDIVGDAAYLFGGRSKKGFSGDIFRINLLSYAFDAPETQGESPERRAFHLTYVFGTKVIVVGGFNDRTLLDDYFVFSTATHVWRKGSLSGKVRPRPREWASFSVGAVDRGDILVVFGGYFYTHDLEFEENLNDLWSLDLTNNTWHKIEARGEPPQPRCGHTAVTIGSKMFVFGGAQLDRGTACKYFNDLYVLRSDADESPEWEKLSPLGEQPTPRAWHTMKVYGEYLVLFGGKSATGLLDDLWLLEVRTITWRRLETVGGRPRGRYRHATAIYGDYLILIGGATQRQLGYQRFLHRINLRGAAADDADKDIEDTEVNPAAGLGGFTYY
eukprot:TRINITY_DN879_c0_g1_i1.p1 TRINITY_DN879_c0_g1~~TRINITY_DN879_c0_g1_i1.p1  ORF type:complete len:594 (+),score=117.05 TRINITY_DN879_c0_g1_i1:17-1798(+)